MALNILHDHHCVIKQQSQGQDDTGQGHHVKLNAHQPHQGNGCRIDKGNGQQNHQHLPETCQKEKHHKDRHENCIPQGFKHVLGGLDNGVFLGIGDLEIKGWILYFYLLKLLFNPVNGPNHITFLPPLYGQGNGLFRVAEIAGAVLVMTKVDIADVTKRYTGSEPQ